MEQTLPPEGDAGLDIGQCEPDGAPTTAPRTSVLTTMVRFVFEENRPVRTSRPDPEKASASTLMRGSPTSRMRRRVAMPVMVSVTGS